VSVFRSVEGEKADHAVATMCRVLVVSSSGFWAWSRRQPSARARSGAVLTDTIRTLHARSRGTSAMPRVHAELRDTGHPLLAPAGGPADARRRPRARALAADRPDDGARPRRRCRAGPRGADAQRPPARTPCGSPTSPTSRRGGLPLRRGRARCRPPSRRGSVDGRAPAHPSSYSTPSTWPSRAVDPARGLIHPSDRGTSARASPSADAAARPAWS
jgi:hypothetical protein